MTNGVGSILRRFLAIIVFQEIAIGKAAVRKGLAGVITMRLAATIADVAGILDGVIASKLHQQAAGILTKQHAQMQLIMPPADGINGATTVQKEAAGISMIMQAVPLLTFQ
jgi:hypothetical protein